jgi:hypothetical protein
MAEKRLPSRERRERYGSRVDVIERFRLGREIIRMDGYEFRSAAIAVKRSKAARSILLLCYFMAAHSCSVSS